ncbi:MAG TPA: alpha/beta fold hydrolase [Vicinamibacterales bacterium]|nr:alpha/beta fold hydrolase [Vicinamibacterales bacterium]
MRRVLIGITMAVTAALGLAVSAQVQHHDVDIKAPDGVNLRATYYSSGRKAPGILLLHQCNMDRHAWDQLAADLAAEGFNVLTMDYRGYGESGGEHFKDFAQMRPVMQEKWPGDVDAAYAWLLKQPGVDTRAMGAGGASCGVTESADLAERHHEIKALMLLSGRVSPKAKAHITSSDMPVFGAASHDDTGPGAGIREAVGASHNTHSVLKIYPGKLHGVPMFGQNAELEPMIVKWFKARLLTGAATR